jgi:hypothetical protein
MCTAEVVKPPLEKKMLPVAFLAIVELPSL